MARQGAFKNTTQTSSNIRKEIQKKSKKAIEKYKKVLKKQKKRNALWIPPVFFHVPSGIRSGADENFPLFVLFFSSIRAFLF